MIENFCHLLDNAPFIFHSIDMNGIILGVSQGWLQAFGYSKDEVLGRNFAEFLTLESKIYAKTVIYPNFLRNGQCHNIHFKLMKKNGDIVDILVSAIMDKKNDKAIAFITDVTNQFETEKELRLHRNKLRELVEERTKDLEKHKEMYRTLSRVSPVGIIRFVSDDKCVYTNKKWQKLTGTTLEECLGMGWAKIFHPDDRELNLTKWFNFTNSNDEYFELECRIQNTDGTIKWGLFQANRIVNGETGFVGTITDITKKKEVLPQLIELKKESSKRRQYRLKGSV